MLIIPVLFVCLAIVSTRIMRDSLFDDPLSFILEDEKGHLLGARIGEDGQWRFPEMKEVPEKFIIAITAYEDHRFYDHSGLDPLSLFRAFRLNLKHGKVISGGSTLTMQVARLMQKNPPRTLVQKTYEGILAWILEKKYSKERILSLYASNAPFGGNVVGLEAASWRYFGRPPGNLSWAEACMLAVLPNSPGLIHPGRNRQSLLNKRNALIDKLCRLGYFDEETALLAKSEPIPVQPSDFPRKAPHLLERLRALSATKSEYRAICTLDENLQDQMYTILDRYRYEFTGNGINNAALIVIEVETGKTLVYIGNYHDMKDKENGFQVDIITSNRSTGSILKPFLYAAMLSSGELTPNALVADIPVNIGSYAPRNYNRGYDGAVPANKALARSLNVPAVKMLQSFGVNRFIHVLRKLGMTTVNRSADHYGLSLILGGCEGSLWEICGIYASMARSLNHFNSTGDYCAGDYRMPYLVMNENKTGTCLEDKNSILSAGAIWYTLKAMSEVERPPEESHWELFSSSGKIAWKTGTSFGFRDGWAIGINPGYVAGIWIGNADGEGRPELTGIKTAALVLFDVFKLLPSENWFDEPMSDFTRLPVCRTTGYLAGPNCPETDSLLLPKACSRSQLCPYHHLIHLDNTGTWQVHSECEATENMIHTPWFILPPAMEYYYKMRYSTYKTPPPFREDCQDQVNENNSKVMELIYPRNFTKLYIPREFDGSPGAAIFEVAHRKPGIKLYWSIDKHFICETKDFHQVAVHPEKGKHLLTVMDENGETIAVSFEIIDKEED